MTDSAAAPEPAAPEPAAPEPAAPEPAAFAEPGWRSPVRGGRAGNGFFVLLIRGGGMVLAPFFLVWVALYFVVAAPAARRASFDLARRLGRGGSTPARVWFAFRHFYTYGLLLLDRIAILGAGQLDRYRITFHGEEILRAAARGGRGVVLQSAHIGNWEVMGHLVQRIGAPFTMVMYDAIDAESKAMIEDMARHRSFRILYSDGSPAAAAAILATLRRGELVGMMGDRVVAGDSVTVTLLGSEAELPAGSYVVCAAARAPLVHVIAVRTGWRRYDVYGSAAVTLAYTDRKRKRQDLARWAGAFAGHIEEFLRAYPWQWGNFFPFWKAPA